IIDQEFVGFLHRGLNGLRAVAAHRLLQHVVDVQHTNICPRHSRYIETAGRGAIVGHLHLDFLVVEFAVAQLLPGTIAGCRARCAADERFQNAFFSIEMSARFYAFAHLFAGETDGYLDQVAYDLLYVAADITNFGKLGGLNLDKGSSSQLGKAARYLGLANTGRTDHQDVLRHDLFAQARRELLPAPAITHGDGNGALGVVLPNDVAVEFRNGFAGRKSRHFNVTVHFATA